MKHEVTQKTLKATDFHKTQKCFLDGFVFSEACGVQNRPGCFAGFQGRRRACVGHMPAKCEL